jgi:hypothetical protein
MVLRLTVRRPEISVDANHHVGGLDDRIGGSADSKAEFIDGLVGDRRRDDRAVADVYTNMRGRGALGDIDDCARLFSWCPRVDVVSV